MNTLFRLSLFFACFCLATTLFAQPVDPEPNSFPLRINVEEGQTFRLCFESAKFVCVCLGGGNQAIATTRVDRINYFLRLEVKEVTGSGDTRFKVTCERVGVDSASWYKATQYPTWGIYTNDWDSATVKAYCDFQQTLDSLQGEFFHVVLSPRGEILDVSGWDQFAPNELRSFNRFFGGITSNWYKKDLLSVFLSAWPIYPEDSVTTMAYWEEKPAFPHLYYASYPNQHVSDSTELILGHRLHYVNGDSISISYSPRLPAVENKPRRKKKADASKLKRKTYALRTGVFIYNKRTGMPIGGAHTDHMMNDKSWICLDCQGKRDTESVTIRPYDSWLDKLIQQTD